MQWLTRPGNCKPSPLDVIQGMPILLLSASFTAVSSASATFTFTRLHPRSLPSLFPGTDDCVQERVSYSPWGCTNTPDGRRGRRPSARPSPVHRNGYYANLKMMASTWPKEAIAVTAAGLHIEDQETNSASYNRYCVPESPSFRTCSFPAPWSSDNLHGPRALVAAGGPAASKRDAGKGS